MIDPDTITEEDLDEAVTNINERAEYFATVSQLFVDTNLVNILSRKKNQVVYGRRGTGKTHLFNRIKEQYRAVYKQEKLLPIYVDGKTFSEIPV